MTTKHTSQIPFLAPMDGWLDGTCFALPCLCLALPCHYQKFFFFLFPFSMYGFVMYFPSFQECVRACWRTQYTILCFIAVLRFFMYFINKIFSLVFFCFRSDGKESLFPRFALCRFVRLLVSENSFTIFEQHHEQQQHQ